MRRNLRLLFLAALLVCPTRAGETNAPWRLAPALDFPAWLEIRGSHRTRYETLDHQYRAGHTGSDEIVSFQTLLLADFKFQNFGATAELLDARVALANANTSFDASLVNTLEPIQAFVSARAANHELRLGRQTMEIGSRRLVSIPSFSAPNSFTGARMLSSFPKFALQLFYTLPTLRDPSDTPSLLDHDIEFDHESFDAQFWGAHTRWPLFAETAAIEAYAMGLHETDSPSHPTRDRQLVTPGLRFSRSPFQGRFDFEAETIVQFGQSRATSAPGDRADLHHLAHFEHLEGGFTFHHQWRPRVAAMFDYASGDENPADGTNNRFDTLFGARRFEHGATSLYGPFARSNIKSPGLVFAAQPHRTVDVTLFNRLYWLASRTDAWTAANLRDPSGRSGSFLGEQLEARVRWEILPGNLRLELGGAHLFRGHFVDRVPNSPAAGHDLNYAYASIDLRF